MEKTLVGLLKMSTTLAIRTVKLCLALTACGQPSVTPDVSKSRLLNTDVFGEVDSNHRVIAAGKHFKCTPIAVWDGDGPVWCDEGPKLRLAGIAAREHDESCRANQPCPAATGVAARDALVILLGGATGTRSEGHVKVAGPQLECLSRGGARGNRTAAWCRMPDGRNLSCEMIASGTALRWPKYDPDNSCGYLQNNLFP
jgi:endonuclease YncB( thermonuclease family)